jgi:curli biogenesis system outer membrane secretion channel CsgG
MNKINISFIVLFLIVIGNLSFVFDQNGIVIAQPQSEKKQQAIKNGLRLFKAEKLDESEEVFENILKHDNKTLIAREMLAIIAFRKGDYARAEKIANMCLKQNRKSAKAHLVLAGVYREKDNILASRDHLRKSKKYSSPREKETIAAYIKNDTNTVIEQVTKSPIKKSDLTLNVPEAGKLPYIAIFTFEDSNKEEDQDEVGKSFSEMLTTALIQTECFQILERSQLDKILEEQALGLSGAIDENTAVDVGELLGIDAVVVGSCKIFDDQIEIDARIVDAQNGKAHLAASVSAEDESELRAASLGLAKKLASGAEKIPMHREEKTPAN